MCASSMDKSMCTWRGDRFSVSAERDKSHRNAMKFHSAHGALASMQAGISVRGFVVLEMCLELKYHKGQGTGQIPCPR
jgi:hypothetical protein